MATKKTESKQSTVSYIMNFLVSGYVYFVAFMLVLYMVSTLATSLLGTALELIDLASNGSSLFTSASKTELELSLLHTIAFTIVLVKAYKILVAYAETKHINIKFLVEIAIIAPTIELVFNSANYEIETQALLASTAAVNLIIYLFFYKTLKMVSKDHEAECAN